MKISPLSKEDFSDILEMYNEPDSNKYIRPLWNKTEAEFIQFFEKKLMQNKIENGLGFWVARQIPSGEFIGTANLNFFFNTERIQVGCHLSNRFWNKGFATTILKELLNHGFKDKQLPKIYAFFEADNIASKKALIKLGFIRLAEERHFDVDLQVYKLDKETWI